MEDFKSKFFQIFVSSGVIVCFVIVRTTVDLDYKSKLLHEKVNDIVAYDFLSVKIKPMEDFFVYLFPKRDFGHIASFAIFTCVTQQLSIFREIVDVAVFYSDAVDDCH